MPRECDDLAPALDLLPQERSELHGAAADRLHAVRDELAAHLVAGDRGLGRSRGAFCIGRPEARRSKQAIPRAVVEAGQHFRDRCRVGISRHTTSRAHRKQLQLAALDQFLNRCNVAEHEVDVAAHGIGQCLPGAFVGRRGEIEVRLFFQHLAGKVVGAADAGHTDAVLAWVRLDDGHQLAQVVGGKFGPRDKQKR